MNKIISSFIVLGTLLLGTLAHSQNYPVHTTLQVRSPYTTYLPDYFDGTDSKFSLGLQLMDATVSTVSVKLRFQLEGPSGTIVTNPLYQQVPITIHYGEQVMLQGSDLSSYFLNGNNLVFPSTQLRDLFVNKKLLPEGLWKICVDVLDAHHPNAEPLSSQSCSVIFTTSGTPPVLNLPLCGDSLTLNQVINFSWTDFSLGTQTIGNEPVYDFYLYGLPTTAYSSPTQVLNTSPLYHHTTSETSLMMGINDFKFSADYHYVWRVKAHLPNNAAAYLNNGYSSYCDFVIKSNAPKIKIIATATGINPSLGTVSWQLHQFDPISNLYVPIAATTGSTYTIAYRATTSSTLPSLSTSATPALPASSNTYLQSVQINSSTTGLSSLSTSATPALPASSNTYLQSVQINSSTTGFSDVEPTLFLNQLNDSTQYQVTVSDESGNTSNTATFTTPPYAAYTCGDRSLDTIPTNYTPLQNAIPGIKVTQGLFDMTVSTISPTADGSPGHFTGTGIIIVDFLKIPLKVKFDDLLIDDTYLARSGDIKVEAKELSQWLNEQYAAEAEPTTIDGTISTVVMSEDKKSVTVTTTDGTTLTFAVSDPIPTVLHDDQNNEYQCFSDGHITKTYFNVTLSEDVIDASKDLHLDFVSSTNETYPTDVKKYAHLADNYEFIQCPTAGATSTPATPGTTTTTTDSYGYFVAIKSARPNTADVVHAKLTKGAQTTFDASGLTFKTQNGTEITYETQGEEYVLSLPSATQDYSVYAFYNDKKIGKLNVIVLSEVTKKITIVPLVASVGYSATELQTGLENIYKGANIKTTINLASQFVDPTYTASTVFESPNTTLLAKYTPEMSALRDAYLAANPNFPKDNYLVFVVAGFQDETIDGYMVRGRALGFVKANASSSDFMRTLAHELGHGIGGLTHTWGEDVSLKGKTTNLMDYDPSDGVDLIADEWKKLHDSPLVINLLDGEEDGSLASGLNAYYFWEEDVDGYVKESVVNKPFKKNMSALIKDGCEGAYKYSDSYLTMKNIVSKDIEANFNASDNPCIATSSTTELKSTIYIVTPNKGWRSISRQQVVYFDIYTVNGVQKRKFSHCSDMVTMSKFGINQSATTHYLVKTFRNSDESIVDQQVFTYFGVDVTNQFTSNAKNAPKRYLIFSNGYRGPQNNWDESDGLVTTNDRFSYWGNIDNLFYSEDRLNCDKKNIYYIDGSFKITTSNHISMLNYNNSSSSLEHCHLHQGSFDCSQYACNCHSDPYSHLNTNPNVSGFDYRQNLGRKAGKAFLTQIKSDPRSVGVKDTIDIVAHSMGYAYAVGFIEAIKNEVHFGRFYIIAPENAGSGGNDWNMFEEVWQYGSNNNVNDPDRDHYLKQDGVAPQIAVKNIENIANGGRAYIPKTVSMPSDQPLELYGNFLGCHILKNYTWIFNLAETQNGYVKKRK